MAGPTVLNGAWGYSISASSGTGNVNILTDPKGSIRVCGIAAGGTSTADIITVLDGNNIQLFGAVGNSAAGANSLTALQLASTIRVTGLNVTFVGGTSGQCFVYIPSANY